MSREAMQMALDMLNEIADDVYCDQKLEGVITALRQALETEQEPLYWNVADGWVTADPAEVGEVQAQSELRRLHERCEQWRDIHDAVVADSDKVYALLRQALEALDSDNPDIQLRAATSLRQALVNADDTSKKRVDEMVKLEHDKQIEIAQAYERGWNAVLAQQEPVAWISEGGDVSRSKRYMDEMGFKCNPLYTAPPKRDLTCVCGAVWEGEMMVHPPRKREWVGLTDDEIMEPWPFENRIAFARWLESKIKENNCGH